MSALPDAPRPAEPTCGSCPIRVALCGYLHCFVNPTSRLLPSTACLVPPEKRKAVLAQLQRRWQTTD